MSPKILWGWRNILPVMLSPLYSAPLKREINLMENSQKAGHAQPPDFKFNWTHVTPRIALD